MHRYRIRLKREKGNSEFEDNVTDGIKILKLRIYSGRMWVGFIWLRIGTSGGLWGHCYEASSSIDGRELLA
jgi:hypothetical protein